MRRIQVNRMGDERLHCFRLQDFVIHPDQIIKRGFSGFPGAILNNATIDANNGATAEPSGWAVVVKKQDLLHPLGRRRQRFMIRHVQQLVIASAVKDEERVDAICPDSRQVVDARVVDTLLIPRLRHAINPTQQSECSDGKAEPDAFFLQSPAKLFSINLHIRLKEVLLVRVNLPNGRIGQGYRDYATEH